MSATVQSIQGRKGKKTPKQSAPRPPVEAPNTLQSKVTGRIIDVLCEGEIVGLVDGAKSIYLDGTPLQNSDDSYNFEGFNWSINVGTADQDPLTGFSQVENEISVGVLVEQATPVTRTISDSNLDAVRVKIRIPQLTSQASNGDLLGNSVEFKIEIQQNGGSFELATLKNETNPIIVNGKNTSPYEVGYRIDLPTDDGGAPWNIRVTRISADGDTATNQSQIYWSTYTTIIDAKMIYPDTSHLGIEVDASLFGNELPERSYEIYATIVRVPYNYDPETREYTGIWDGTFKLAWTDNPAWILYDLITSTRYGIGEYISTSQIDVYTLYDIGVYCDELVDDGFGGQEPRFTFNGIIETQEDAYDVINAICSTFRGMCYWSSGQIFFSQDAPSDVKKLVTPSNVIDGMFEYSGTALKARHSAALVSWNNPDDGYKLDIEVVEDVDLINQFGWRQLDIVAFGCTSRGQARRFGKWALDVEKNEKETVQYKASLDHIDLRPGDLIHIADPMYATTRMGGRIVSFSKTFDGIEVTVDNPVIFNSGETYILMITKPDGSILSLDVTNTPGSESDLIMANAYNPLSVLGAVFFLHENFSQSGSSLTAWLNDSSLSSAYNFDLAAGAPTIIENGADAHSVVGFDGTDDGVSIPYNGGAGDGRDILNNKSGVTIHFVSKITAGDNPSDGHVLLIRDLDGGIWLDIRCTSSNKFEIEAKRNVDIPNYLLLENGDNILLEDGSYMLTEQDATPDSTQIVENAGTYTDDTWHVCTLALNFSTGTLDFWMDGTKTASAQTFSDYPGNSGAVSAKDAYIASGFGAFTDMQMAAVAMWDGIVSDVNIQAFHEFANEYWSTQEDVDNNPKPGAMFIVTGTDIEPRPFRILGVKEEDKNIFQVTALFHDENKYARVEQDIVLDTPTFTLATTGALQPPSDITIQEYLKQTGPALITAMTISWTPSPDPRARYYVVEYKEPNSSGYKHLKTVQGTSVDLLDTVVGVYSIKIKAVDNLNGLNSETITQDIEVLGFEDPPDDVENFKLSVVGETAYFSWDKVASLDLHHYIIKYSPKTDGTAKWNTAQILSESVPGTTTSWSLPALTGTYMIKAVDSYDAVSDNAAIIITEVAGLINLNVVETISGEAPTWAGDFEDTENNSGVLQLVADAMYGYYYFSQTVDLGNVFTSRISAILTAFGTDLLNTMDDWPNVDEVTNWDGGEPDQWNITLEVRYSQTGPGNSDMSEWEPVVIGDYTARYFEFRLYLESLQEGISPAVEDAQITIDMPDRVEGNNNISSDSGADTIITFVNAFNTIPAIAVTAESLANDDYYVISGQSAAGFTINFYNASATRISRTFDWVAKGYGRKTA